MECMAFVYAEQLVIAGDTGIIVSISERELSAPPWRRTSIHRGQLDEILAANGLVKIHDGLNPIC
jgi:hypothetical protein